MFQVTLFLWVQTTDYEYMVRGRQEEFTHCLELPFPPYNGLDIEFPDGMSFVCSHVRWDIESESFVAYMIDAWPAAVKDPDNEGSWEECITDLLKGNTWRPADLSLGMEPLEAP